MTKYCTYIFKKGDKKGTKCMELCYLTYDFCKKHAQAQQGTSQAQQGASQGTSQAQQGASQAMQSTSQAMQSTSQAQQGASTQQSDSQKIKAVSKIITKKIQEDFIKDRILNLQTSDSNKMVIFKHYSNMKRTDSSSSEYYKNQLFVDLSLSYPWDKYFDINTKIAENGHSIVSFLNHIRDRLDASIHGMDNVKNEILNVVCKFITNPYSNRNNIALYGPAGVGKSKFIQVLSEVLDLPMKSISLGGIKDSSFFLGHGYVYVESGPGKIIQNVIDSKISNPIIYFDELDKVSETEHGKDIFSFLCYLTDPTQNHSFSDHYFYGMHFDLSKVFYVFTFNDIDKIDKILLDRLNIIKVECPSENEIVDIIQTHCIPEITQNVGIQKPIVFNNQNIKFIINYCNEFIDKKITSGIREYYRIIEKVILEINKDILFNANVYSTYLLDTLNIKPNRTNYNIDYNRETIEITENIFQSIFNNIKNQLSAYTKINFSCAHMYL